MGLTLKVWNDAERVAHDADNNGTSVNDHIRSVRTSMADLTPFSRSGIEYLTYAPTNQTWPRPCVRLRVRIA